jgi:rhodanese-related sulfurtransferase
MSVQQVNPMQTYTILQQDKNAVYIDVRTQQEFERGHVPGATNIPVVLPDPAGRMTPSPNFLTAVEASYAKDKKIIVGCQMGGRSQYAADLLVQAGYTDVSNMHGGFGGAKDPMGRLVAPGWLQSDLPVEK